MSKKRPCRILHFKLDASALKAAAVSRKATVTAYLLALMFAAGKRATDELKGIMNIQVPVNMRKFYPSDTLMNFSMYCGIKLPLCDILDLDSLCENISGQLGQNASKQSMSEMMKATERIVSILRYIPLLIKAPAARIVYGFLGDKVFSSTLSNLGAVKLPPSMEEHIDSMDLVLGASNINRAYCALITFRNTATLSITKMTADPSFEEALFKLLASDGVAASVEGSELYED